VPWCSCPNVLSVKMEQLHGLIGCWKAVGFVDPTDYRVSLQSRSSSAADVMKRNELVRLMATTDEQVLYGVACT
jgi:hypothetical protein